MNILNHKKRVIWIEWTTMEFKCHQMNQQNFLILPLKELYHQSIIQKLSLLGHGPHGKQVVDHLLKVYGESGISVFCQQWRRVFVDAVHPRFLAPGWDVNHSGRREFGDFSVYNPSKLSFEATKS
ncbi:unnamed protein product [Rhodiola kirilowii]